MNPSHTITETLELQRFRLRRLTHIPGVSMLGRLTAVGVRRLRRRYRTICKNRTATYVKKQAVHLYVIYYTLIHADTRSGRTDAATQAMWISSHIAARAAVRTR